MGAMSPLAILFFIIALSYSLVGFGGGSSYIALLALFSVPYTFLPKIALICNLLVVTGGLTHSVKARNFSFKFLLPFILSSIPMAYLGGKTPISEKSFMILLGVCLLLAGLKMLLSRRIKNYGNFKTPKIIPSLILGAILGLVSGMVGIGGGIFLSPALFLLKWGNPKKIAATATGFIWINSLAGLFGQLQKGNNNELLSYWPLFLAVLIGGQIGSYFCNRKISPRKIEIFTSFLVLIVSGRLLLLGLF
jgi:uncharacterized membrane protein YfcA